jgi:hypothetical protein
MQRSVSGMSTSEKEWALRPNSKCTGQRSQTAMAMASAHEDRRGEAIGA